MNSVNSVTMKSRRVLSLLLSLSLACSGFTTTARAQDVGSSLSWEPGLVDVTNPDVTNPKKFPPPGKPFRFSLCENRTLKADEVSKPCQKSNADGDILKGGHNAPYVFSTGLTFLPPGLTLDGFGVLSGTADVDISKVSADVLICVRQLGEAQNCGGLGNFGGIQSINNTLMTPAEKAAAAAAATATATATAAATAAATASPPPTAAPTSSGGNAVLGALVAIAAVGALVVLMQGPCPSGEKQCGSSSQCCPAGKYYVPCTQKCQTCPQANNSCFGAPCQGATQCN